MNNEILNKFITVMNECGFDIREETMDEELQYDSLQFVSTMVSFEDAFGIEIPDQYLSAEGLDNARDMFNLVLELLELK